MNFKVIENMHSLKFYHPGYLICCRIAPAYQRAVVHVVHLYMNWVMAEEGKTSGWWTYEGDQKHWF